MRTRHYNGMNATKTNVIAGEGNATRVPWSQKGKLPAGQESGRNGKKPPAPQEGGNPNPGDEDPDDEPCGGSRGGTKELQIKDTTDDLVHFGDIMAQALARGNQRHGDLSHLFKNKSWDDVKVGLLQCKDYFCHSPHQWSTDRA